MGNVESKKVKHTSSNNVFRTFSFSLLGLFFFRLPLCHAVKIASDLATHVDTVRVSLSYLCTSTDFSALFTAIVKCELCCTSKYAGFAKTEQSIKLSEHCVCVCMCV